MSGISLTASERHIAECSINADPKLAWTVAELADFRARVKEFRCAQQKLRCYCRQKYDTKHGRVWDLDHVLCRSKFPQFTYEVGNLHLACPDCDQIKGSTDVFTGTTVPRRYPKSSGAFTIIHPESDKYDDHIVICFESYYVPLDKKGSNTISTCGLYRYNSRHQLKTDDTEILVQIILDKLTRAKDPATLRSAFLEVVLLAQRVVRDL